MQSSRLGEAGRRLLAEQRQLDAEAVVDRYSGLARGSWRQRLTGVDLRGQPRSTRRW